MNILTMNAGSSSLKFKIFSLRSNFKTSLLLSGEITNITSAKQALTINNIVDNTKIQETLQLKDNVYKSAVEYLIAHSSFTVYSLNVVINRVVHGGDEYKDILLLHPRTINELAKFNPLAPLHQPFNLLIASNLLKCYPKLKHYAAFDTAFHQTMPKINRAYAIPWKYFTDGVKRYGFHGLSYQYISQILPNLVESKLARGRFIIAHLGGGSSICGIKNGKSVATTMGFSAAEGLPMATRCGELDPAIPLYLEDKYKLTEAAINDLFYHQSGLFGLSNQISGDMQTLLASKDAQAKFAVEFFTLAVASYISKIATQLGGVKGIIFTGGIGENSPIIREMIVKHLDWLGIAINKKANKGNKLKFHKKDCKVKLMVVVSNEEQAMINQFIERNK